MHAEDDEQVPLHGDILPDWSVAAPDERASDAAGKCDQVIGGGAA
jgi:hypothetical protein